MSNHQLLHLRRMDGCQISVKHTANRRIYLDKEGFFRITTTANYEAAKDFGLDRSATRPLQSSSHFAASVKPVEVLD